MGMRDKDLHGSAPDKCATALLLIDVINDVDFPEADHLLRFAVPMATRLRALKRNCREAGIPVIYINDNFGRWQSNFGVLVKHCLASRGKPVVKLLLPRRDDYFVLKPKHSGFYSTTLATLLSHLGTKWQRTFACCSLLTTHTCGTSGFGCPEIASARTRRGRMILR
jgi:nicotinamidase-related amidase